MVMKRIVLFTAKYRVVHATDLYFPLPTRGGRGRGWEKITSKYLRFRKVKGDKR